MNKPSITCLVSLASIALVVSELRSYNLSHGVSNHCQMGTIYKYQNGSQSIEYGNLVQVRELMFQSIMWLLIAKYANIVKQEKQSPNVESGSQ